MVELDPIWIRWPHARIRRELDIGRGEITRFVVQLEYDPNAGLDGSRTDSWHVVARFDHDATTESGHDITEEGLHLDVYRDGERYRRSWNFPRLPPPLAMRYCERYLQENGEQLLQRFEQWHDFDDSV